MALTAKETQTVETLRKHRGNRRLAAEELGIGERAMYRRIKALKQAGRWNLDETVLSPLLPGIGREITHVSSNLDSKGNITSQSVKERAEPGDENYVDTSEWDVKMVTTAIKDGEVVQQWPRHFPPANSETYTDRLISRLETLPTFPRISNASATMDNSLASLANLYVLSDAHIGMLSWGQETGADWDLKIAQDMLVKAFQAMVMRSAPAGKAIVVLLGDWFHYDGLHSITPTSGNILDADSRPGRMVDVAIDVAIALVHFALEHHEKVELLIAEGNHDLMTSMITRKMFKRLFSDNERLHILDHEAPFYAMRHGDCFLGFHHGHLKGVKKPDELINVFSHDFADIWGGRNSKRYIHTGDKHFVYEDGSRGTIIKQHPTIAARDAWAARNGFLNMRFAKSESYHERWGEVGGYRVSPEMVADWESV